MGSPMDATKGLIAAPLDTHDKGAVALPSLPSSRGVPAPCIPASLSPVDCSFFGALSAWRDVYPLATLRPCQEKTQACAFGSSVRFAMSFCACAGHKTNRLHRCFGSSCGTMSRRTPPTSPTHTTKPPPNRRATRRDERATGDCDHFRLPCQAVRP